MCPGASFLLEVFSIKQSLKEIRTVLRGFTNFDSHIIKVVQNHLSSLTELVHTRSRDNQISSIFDDIFLISDFLHQVFQGDRAQNDLILLDSISIFCLFHDVSVTCIRSSHSSLDLVGINEFCLDS